MFNRIFKESRFEDSRAYTRIAASEAADAVFLFKELGLTGMNVTAPFKNDIMAFVDEIEPAGSAVGGINTVVNRNGRLYGYNIDICPVRI